jgi:hypothetical protein
MRLLQANDRMWAFFAERQKRGTSAAAVGFEHHTTGGGNTPYVYGDWAASSVNGASQFYEPDAC